MNHRVTKAIKENLGKYTPRELREAKRRWNATPRNERSIKSLSK